MRILRPFSLVILLIGLMNFAEAAEYGYCIYDSANKVELKKEDNVAAMASAIVGSCESSIESDISMSIILGGVGADVKPVERSILLALLRQEARAKGFNAAINTLIFNQRSK